MDELVNDRQAVYTYLMECELMIKVSTFAVTGGVVNHDYVVIHDAPPKAVREIVTNFSMVKLCEGDGLLIPVTPLPRNN